MSLLLLLLLQQHEGWLAKERRLALESQTFMRLPASRALYEANASHTPALTPAYTTAYTLYSAWVSRTVHRMEEKQTCG